MYDTGDMITHYDGATGRALKISPTAVLVEVAPKCQQIWSRQWVKEDEAYNPIVFDGFDESEQPIVYKPHNFGSLKRLRRNRR